MRQRLSDSKDPPVSDLLVSLSSPPRLGTSHGRSTFPMYLLHPASHTPKVTWKNLPQLSPPPRRQIPSPTQPSAPCPMAPKILRQPARCTRDSDVDDHTQIHSRAHPLQPQSSETLPLFAWRDAAHRIARHTLSPYAEAPCPR